MSTLKINETPTAPLKVNFCWPKPPAKPNIEGFVDCEVVVLDQEALEALDAQVESGEISIPERFERLVPVINGLPTAEGQSAHDWIESHRYGSIVRAAIFDGYLEMAGSARAKNSSRRRRR
jgi:hypothetical protein